MKSLLQGIIRKKCLSTKVQQRLVNGPFLRCVRFLRNNGFIFSVPHFCASVLAVCFLFLAAQIDLFIFFGSLAYTRSVVVTSSSDNDKFSAPKIDCNTVRVKKIDNSQCARYLQYAKCNININIGEKMGECEAEALL